MKIMLDCSPKKISEYSVKYDYSFWQLRTPLTRYKLAGVPYGLDNGCFSGFREREWEKLLDEARSEEWDINGSNIKFVCAPDFVGCAVRTLDLFNVFKRRLNGLPRAIVLQDGIGRVQIPWDEVDAVFVGGSDTFKTSKEAMDACKVAKMLGKWVHIGRVNSSERVEYWRGIADSIDGSGMSRFDQRLEIVLAAIRNEDPQMELTHDCGE